MSRFTAARPFAIGVIAAAVLVAGCSSKKASSSGTPSASAPSASSTTTSGTSGSSAPAPSISGDPAAVKLYTQAMQGLANAKSVHIKGSATQEGQTFAVDLTFLNGKGATGSVGLGGGTMQLIALNGDTYIQFDAKALAAFAGSSVPAAASQALAGKWLKVSAAEQAQPNNPFAGINGLTDLKQFAKDFQPSGAVTENPKKTTINGQSAIALNDNGGSDPSHDGILYVQAGGNHLPLEIVPGPSASASTGSEGPAIGKIDFLEYNKDVTLTAPSGAIDMSQLMALLGGGGASSPAS
jgi:hypothetical protein